MGTAYQIRNQKGMYFITNTVHQWVDVFTRKIYVDILLDSLIHCQQHMGLEIYAWVIMSNHCHLVVSSQGKPLSDIIRDSKKFTSKKIIDAIEHNPNESRKSWLLWLLKKEDKKWFWNEGYHGEEILTKKFYERKVNYIHMNPVSAGIVAKEEDYNLSSCGDFYGHRKGPLKLSIF